MVEGHVSGGAKWVAGSKEQVNGRQVGGCSWMGNCGMCGQQVNGEQLGELQGVADVLAALGSATAATGWRPAGS